MLLLKKSKYFSPKLMIYNHGERTAVVCVLQISGCWYRLCVAFELENLTKEAILAKLEICLLSQNLTG